MLVLVLVPVVISRRFSADVAVLSPYGPYKINGIIISGMIHSALTYAIYLDATY